MKKVYTAFSFNGVVYTDLINVSLENNMYSENMRGNRTLLKEKIPGRDIPYFYAVEDEALEFDVVFALTVPKSKAELRVMLRNLITQTGYKELHFGDYNPTTETYTRQSPIYKVIFDGESKLDFVGTNVYNEGEATLKYFAYFTLKAHADRPYGYEALTATVLAAGYPESGILVLNNTGDLEVLPNIVITNGATAYNVPIRIYNSTAGNLTSITFSSLAANEVITINADLKTITSTVAGVYTRWTERDDLKLSVGNNTLNIQQYIGGNWVNITTNPWASIVFTIQAPTFIKE
jgi:hypothetical protein